MSKFFFHLSVFCLFFLLILPASTVSLAEDGTYLKAAKAAAEWVKNCAIDTPAGKKWPVYYDRTDEVNDSLYDGTSGVVVFFLEAFHSTGNSEYLELARSGADHLLDALKSKYNASLYGGLAAFGYALEETYKSTKETRYRDGALSCINSLNTYKTKKATGIEWTKYTDIIAGTAGTGLFLLYIAEETGSEKAMELARAAGDRLVDVALPVDGGLKWWIHPDWTSSQFMPNFSHGTAGIAYFLARLYEETGEKTYLNAAIQGAGYLQSIAFTEGDVCLIERKEGEDPKEYVLGWCHGPAGTSRLFFQLYKVTGDKNWLSWIKRCANSFFQSGFPDQESDMIWGLSQCCGPTGAAQFFLDLYWYTNDTAYLDYSRKLTRYVLYRVLNPDGSYGTNWTSQVGFMQGGAGHGTWFFHLDDFDKGKKWRIVFPDSPWRQCGRYDYLVKKNKPAKKNMSKGDNLNATARISNAGFSKAHKTMVKFYLAKKTSSGLQSPEVYCELQRVKLKSLGMRKKARVKCSAIIPENVTNGKYYVVAAIEVKNNRTDLFAFNNFAVSKSKIRIR